MGYRIDYQPVRRLQNIQQRHPRRAALTGILFLLFLLLVSRIWPEGRRAAQELLFSVDFAAQLINQLECGVPLLEALDAFGQQMMDGHGYAGY